MKNNTETKFVCNMPFPAFEGIRKVAQLLREIGRNGFLASIPRAEFPRRFEMKKAARRPEGADDAVRLELWYERGFYCTLLLAGYNGHYGTQWDAFGLRVRWTANEIAGVSPMRSGEEKWRVDFSGEEIRQIELSGYFCRGAAEEHESAKTDALLAAKADRIQLAVEKQRIWIETLRADRERREGCWIEDQRPFGLPATTLW